MKNETRVIKTALPLYLEGTNGKAVLIQHGYSGYPTEMHGLARRIHAEGYTVVVPRLPGHATNGADFRKTNWKLWYNHVKNEYLNLQSRFESVSVIGLSMGGVLALLMAAEFRPERAILLAPAMEVRPKLVYITPFLQYIIPKIKREWIPATDDGEDRIYMAKEYWAQYYSAQLASMVKLIKMAKRSLQDVICPTYIMLSEKDNSVSLDTGPLIGNGVSGPVKKHILKNSPHVFFEGPENDFVLEKVVKWLKEDENSNLQKMTGENNE